MYEIIEQSSVSTPSVMATDCACAGVTASPRTQQRPPVPSQLLSQLTVPPRLHSEPLPGAHWALFDPDGAGGVVVVNAATYNLLHSCAHGITAVPMDSGCSREVTQQAIHALIESGMLVPVGARIPAAAPKPHALSAWLHITNDCNMRCSYCYIKKTGQAMPETTGRRAVDAVVRSAICHGYKEVRLKYAGGEPTLRLAQVLSLHDYAVNACGVAQLGLSATLLSNGSLLTERSVVEIKQRNMEVMISLDGVGDEHDLQRPLRSGRPSFSLVKRGIEHLLDAGLRPHLSLTLTAHNCTNAVEAVAFALAHDCTFAQSLPVEPRRCRRGSAAARTAGRDRSICAHICAARGCPAKVECAWRRARSRTPACAPRSRSLRRRPRLHSDRSSRPGSEMPDDDYGIDHRRG